MAKHRIGILSDTHSLLRPEVKAALADCEILLHAGDIASPETAAELRRIAPTRFVRGNADKDWAADLPEDLLMDLFGLRIYMIHNKKYIRRDLEKEGMPDLILYGHSHKYEEIRRGDTLYLNPGSCGPRRVFQPVTLAILTIDEEKAGFEIEKVDLTPAQARKDTAPVGTAADPSALIRLILKDMRKNRPVSEIAERNDVTEVFVSQILQIYTTHPGIDMDGILNRLPEEALLHVGLEKTDGERYDEKDATKKEQSGR